MKKMFSLLYAVASYLVFLFTILYAIGFVGNMVVPMSIDGPAGDPLLASICIDASLLLLFAIQHSVMARPAFKTWWIRIIPEHLERSTYVFLASICLLACMWLWQPIGGIVWETGNQTIKYLLLLVYMIGWALVFASTFLINHFDLFGLRQAWLYFKGRKYIPLPFRSPLFYRLVRHPLYFGFLIAFWATPVMTLAHFLFAMLTTGYILVAIQFEERDLLEVFGDKYRNYKKVVPMIVPFIKKRAGKR